MKHILLHSVLLGSMLALTSFAGHSKLTVTSTAFTDNGKIPTKYSCEGEQASPPLNITNVPKGTVTLALIVHDPDAPMKGGFTHWVVWNLATDGTIPQNFKGAEQGNNSARQKGYMGMCPPTGVHRYQFFVYALDTQLKLRKNTGKQDLEEAMKGHILAEGLLTGLYQKVK